ncbi:hypothetical protein B0H13DRAFT_1879837 [Mycena leptocephala]|nr:hypothetical protein B0H13DRAFT_1879837 [Mycena leptocephala]
MEGGRLSVRKGAVMERLWVRNGAVLAPFVKEMLEGGLVQLEAGGPRRGFEMAPFVGMGGGNTRRLVWGRGCGVIKARLDYKIRLWRPPGVASHSHEEVEPSAASGTPFDGRWSRLTDLKAADEHWVFHFRVDPETHQFQRIFWMSPKQVSLAQRFSDVVINDIAMLCNMYGMPLNIKTADEHEWALSRLFSVLPQHLDRVFFSDWDAGLCAAVGRCDSSEIASHACCLHHLDGSVIRKLAGRLGALLQPFREALCFELAWQQLLLDYPTAAPYLESELWPCYDRWAFTAFRPILDSAQARSLPSPPFIRLHTIKAPKLSRAWTRCHANFGQFHGKNSWNISIIQYSEQPHPFPPCEGSEHSDLPTSPAATRAVYGLRAESKTPPIELTNRFHHPTSTDTLFSQPLQLIRQHCVAYTVQKSYDQMECSVFYEATPVSLPAGATTWAEATGPQDPFPSVALQAADKAERVMIAAECVLNSFTNDSIHISAQLMLRLIKERSWVCTHLFKISHYTSEMVHLIALIDNG